MKQLLGYLPIERSVIGITGQDRATFLHNFCTQDIRGMPQGAVREAMLLDGRGRLLGLVHVFCREQSLELHTVAGQAPGLIQHLDRYIIREDVQLQDASAACAWAIAFPAGAAENGSAETVEQATGIEHANTGWACPSPSMGQFVEPPAGSAISRLAHSSFAGPALLIGWELGKEFPAGELELLAGLPVRLASAAELLRHRVAHGVPWFGVDFGNEHLPQELRRDQQAISFAKGCYLGQETVARIDALGQVNRLLCVLSATDSPSLPEAGSAVAMADKEAGRLTSVVPQGRGWLGLAILRRSAAKPGTLVDSTAGQAKVVAPLV